MAQGRASAWGGAPHSGSPSAGGERPRLISPCPPPAVQEAATEGAETDAAGARSPLFRPKKRVGCRPKRLQAGSGTACGSRGPAKTCLCWLLNLGVSPFLLDLAKCMYPPMLPREGAARRGVGSKSQGPRLPGGQAPAPGDLPFSSRS